MEQSPAPFSEIGRRARDLLTKDYSYDQKFTFSVPSSSGVGITATGVKKDQIFVGDISTQYNLGSTVVDIKVDTYSNVEQIALLLRPAIACPLDNLICDHEIYLNSWSQQSYTGWRFQSTKVSVGFNIPDHKAFDVQYLHQRAAINSSIGLNPSPLLELSAAIGSKDLAQMELRVAAEMIHRLDTYENSFSIGSSHKVDPLTSVKTRFSDNGKVAMLCQREWRPKSLITFSAEYDMKARNSVPKLGLALALKP
ncbi:hypothetical protein HAX54_045994 [Datura stramonium]|uniref:Uncharacterized protein n=1 Tax=Datura stramonium TaxID=4076 RepID=A0ABS8RPM9_DATST|nr:hypothetical protein [Datura stramonium]